MSYAGGGYSRGSYSRKNSASGDAFAAYANESELPLTAAEGALVLVAGKALRWSDVVGWRIPSEWYAKSPTLVANASENNCDLNPSSNITTLAAASYSLTNVSNLAGGGVVLDSVGSLQSRLSFGEGEGNGVTWPTRIGVVLQIDSISQDGTTLRPELRIRNGAVRVEVTFGRANTLNNAGFLSAPTSYHANAEGVLQATSFETLYLEIDFAAGKVVKLFDADASGEVFIGRDKLNADASAAYLAFFTGSTNPNEKVEIRRLQVLDLTGS